MNVSSINRRTILNAVPKTPQPGKPSHDPATGMWYKDSVRQAIRHCYRSQKAQSKRLSHPKTTRSKFSGNQTSLSAIYSSAQTQRKQQCNQSMKVIDLEALTSTPNKGTTTVKNLITASLNRNAYVGRSQHRQGSVPAGNPSKNAAAGKVIEKVAADCQNLRMSSLGVKSPLASNLS